MPRACFWLIWTYIAFLIYLSTYCRYDSLVRSKADYLDICQAHLIMRLPLYTISFTNLFYAVIYGNLFSKNKNRRHEDYAKIWKLNVTGLNFTSIYSSVYYYFIILWKKLLTKESTVLISVFVCVYPFTSSPNSRLAIMQNGKAKYKST